MLLCNSCDSFTTVRCEELNCRTDENVGLCSLFPCGSSTCPCSLYASVSGEAAHLLVVGLQDVVEPRDLAQFAHFQLHALQSAGQQLLLRRVQLLQRGRKNKQRSATRSVAQGRRMKPIRKKNMRRIFTRETLPNRRDSVSLYRALTVLATSIAVFLARLWKHGRDSYLFKIVQHAHNKQSIIHITKSGRRLNNLSSVHSSNRSNLFILIYETTSKQTEKQLYF